MRNLIKILTNKEKIRDISGIDELPSKSIYDVLRPIYILSFIFGLRVFEIPRDHSRPILSWFYSMSLFSLNIGSFRYDQGYLNHTRALSFNETVATGVAIVTHFVVFVIITMGLYYSKALKLCIKKIHKIDKTLQMLGSTSSFNIIYKKAMLNITLTMFIVFLLFAVVISDMLSMNELIYETPTFYFSSIEYLYNFMVEFLLIIEFFTVIHCVQSEFRRANELLSDVNILPITSIASELIERSYPANSKQIFNSLSSSGLIQSRLQVANQKLNRSKTLLRIIRQVHLELCKLSKCFSTIYGIQICTEMVMCILSNTYHLYNFYATYGEKTRYLHGLIYLSFTTILSCLPYLIRIFVVNCICDRTTKEAERTNEIILTFYGNNTDLEIQKEVEIFSLQMMQCRSTYSAFGFYNLNCKQICSCIGFITTYLVILIQANDSINKKS